MLYLSRDFAFGGKYCKPDKETEVVMEFMTLVKKNFITKKMVAEYAYDMSISPNYLNQIVKKISGFTASYYIQQCIILEAKRQAFCVKTRMKEVAYFLGFDNCAHFSKYFKSKCGMNFTSFKNGLHQQAPGGWQ